MKSYDAIDVLDYYIKLPEVFEFYGYEVRNGFCCCPFHYEKTPSCRVNDKQYHCFGCNASGNAISFVKQLFNIDFNTAIQKLNADFNLGLLDAELTAEQKEKIRKRKQIVYERKQENKDVENIKQQYMEAWKHLIYYRPAKKKYDINTPSDLVDEYFDKVDLRYLEALETIAMLDEYAEIYGFKIEEFEAEQIFLNQKAETAEDIAEKNLIKLWCSIALQELKNTNKEDA